LQEKIFCQKEKLPGWKKPEGVSLLFPDKRMSNPVPLPEELFHAVAALIPRLIYIAEEECQIAPIDLLALWHIRHVGKVNAENRNVLLRGELTRMLKLKFRLADSDITKMLDDLQNRGLVERTTITNHERQALFGTTKGQKQVVILTLAGSEKLDHFKTRITTRFGAWVPAASAPVRYATKKMLPIAVSFARWLVSRYEPDRSETLYGATAGPGAGPSLPPVKKAEISAPLAKATSPEAAKRRS
jgi:DNA-binding MarR family transcriptional regulator